MKRINFLLMILLIAGTAVFTSCKKETRIERNLWDKGGEWNVTSWTSMHNGIKTEHIGVDIQSATLTFNKDEEANLIMNGDAGDIYTYKMKYENSESQLIFTNATDQETGEVDYPSITYYMMWEKDKLNLKATNGFLGADTETMILEKDS